MIDLGISACRLISRMGVLSSSAVPTFVSSSSVAIYHRSWFFDVASSKRKQIHARGGGTSLVQRRTSIRDQKSR